MINFICIYQIYENECGNKKLLLFSPTIIIHTDSNVFLLNMYVYVDIIYIYTKEMDLIS